MTEKLICPICGAPTRIYMGNARKDRLCGKHADELKTGQIVKCNNCGEWYYKNQSCKCGKSSAQSAINTVSIERQRQKDGKCIVCGEDSPNGSLCRKCFYEMCDYKDSFDKNSKVFELKDYYFNLRSNIYRMKNIDYVQSNCNKLMALAVLVKDLFNEESLSDRVVNDIKNIIEKKKPQEKQVSSEYSKTQDSRREELLRTADGHYVKSNPESIIDDILYDVRIVHCYEKKVPINADEQTITADWFIPVTDGRHGIYIEYWGMNTKEYLENKERKRKAYKEHDIPLIEIEKDDYKDRQGLSDRLISEINSLAQRYYRIVDFIK